MTYRGVSRPPSISRFTSFPIKRRAISDLDLPKPCIAFSSIRYSASLGSHPLQASRKTSDQANVFGFDSALAAGDSAYQAVDGGQSPFSLSQYVCHFQPE